VALFGTNGVRGLANVEMTPELVLGLARAVGTVFPGIVSVARDTRQSGEMLKAAAISGLLSAGCEVLDLGIAPVPALQLHVREHADAGVMLTASHNPPEYNGFKLIATDGTEAAPRQERQVEDALENKKYRTADWSNTGGLRRDDCIEPYLNALKSLVDRETIATRKLTVVCDPGHGAACLTTPALLSKLGCRVITINAQVDGTFPGRNPEPTRDALGDLAGMVRECGADLGVAHDCDADRVAFIDENGDFLDEEVLLALMARHVLSQRKGSLVTPVSSSQRIEDVAREFGVELFWTRVGSIHVARRMMELNAVFGGEGNGGLIFPEHQYCRDGGASVVKIVELLAGGEKLSLLAGEVTEYHNVKHKMECREPDAVMTLIRDAEKDADTTDGVKLWRDGGWLLIRPSGTEPFIRIYAEHRTLEGAKALADYGRDCVKRFSENR